MYNEFVVMIMYEYKSQKELYLTLIPAMNVKLKLLKRCKCTDITKEEIWNYLKENKWRNSVDLTLADMVQDIIHTDNQEFISFKKETSLE